MNKSLASLFLSVSLCFGAAEQTPYTQQCALIDQHLQDSTKNIEEMISYTLNCLESDADFLAIKQHLPQVKNLGTISTVMTISGYEHFNAAQKMFLHAFAQIHHSSFFEKSGREQILEAGKLCAAMLSKTLFSEKGLATIKDHEYHLIKQEEEFITDLLDLNKIDRRIQVDNFMKKMRSAYGEERDYHLIPMIFMPPHSVFDLKTFLYALSKGVSLYGLDCEDFKGHGGVFPHPLLAFAHDRGHDGELVDSEGEREILQEFATRVLKLLETEVKKEKMVYAAFIMIHETQIKTYISPNPNFSMDKKIKFMFECANHEFGYEEFREKFSERFTSAFFKDIALEIVKVKPKLQEIIWHSDVYNLDLTIKAHINLIRWLEKKMCVEGLFRT